MEKIKSLIKENFIRFWYLPFAAKITTVILAGLAWFLVFGIVSFLIVAPLIVIFAFIAVLAIIVSIWYSSRR